MYLNVLLFTTRSPAWPNPNFQAQVTKVSQVSAMECVAAATWVVGQKTQQVKSLQVLRKLNVDMQVSFQMFSFYWTWLFTVPLGRHISWSLCGAGLPQNHSKSTGIENSKRRNSDNPLQSTTTTCRWPQVCLRSPDCHSRSHRLQLLWFRSDAGCWRHPDLPSGIMVCHQSGSSLKVVASSPRRDKPGPL